jgi:hypothetical protein
LQQVLIIPRDRKKKAVGFPRPSKIRKPWAESGLPTAQLTIFMSGAKQADLPKKAKKAKKSEKVDCLADAFTHDCNLPLFSIA